MIWLWMDVLSACIAASNGPAARSRGPLGPSLPFRAVYSLYYTTTNDPIHLDEICLWLLNGLADTRVEGRPSLTVGVC